MHDRTEYEMNSVKETYIKNRMYYFFEDMVNIKKS